MTNEDIDNFKIEEFNERKRLYEKFRDYLVELQKSNSQNFDKAILSLSSTTLAISLAFIKDIVGLNQANCLILLKFSWFSLVAAIIITVLSFLFSQAGINKQLEYAEQYYINQKDDYLTKKNPLKILSNFSGYFSAFFFIAGIVLTVIFVVSNI